MKTSLTMNFLARAAMLLLLAVLTSATAWADDVTYFDPTTGQTPTATNPTAITADQRSLGGIDNTTWYYVDGTVTNEYRISVYGTVNIILKDGCNFTAPGGFALSENSTLNIYAQSTGDGCGVLTVGHYDDDTAIGGENAAQFGEFTGEDGKNGKNCGTLNIYGGKITVSGNVGGGKGANGANGASDDGGGNCGGNCGGNGGAGGTISFHGGVVSINGNVGNGGNGGKGGKGGGDIGDGGDGGDGGAGGTISFHGGVVSINGNVGKGGNGGNGGSCGTSPYGPSGVNGDNGAGGAGGTISLNWTNATDEIYATEYNGTVTFEKEFINEMGVELPGEYTDNSTINGKTLYPKGTALYTITLSAGVPAYLEASKEHAKAGATITLTAVNGYSVSNVTVKDASNQAVSVTDNNNGTWTFTMPDKNVTVGADATQYYTINAPGYFVITTATHGDCFVQKGTTYCKPQAEVTVTIDDVCIYDNFEIYDAYRRENVSYEGAGPWTFTMPAYDVFLGDNATLDTSVLQSLEGTSDFEVIGGTNFQDDEDEGCEKLFDGKFDEYDGDTPDEDINFSKWCVTGFSYYNANDPCYVEFHTNKPVVPKAYILTTGNDNKDWTGRNPKDWTIQAKLNLGDNWVTIAEVTNKETMKDENFTDYTFAFNNAANNAYQYFRFNITATRGANVMQLSEMRMWVMREQQTLTAKTADNVKDYWTTFYNGTTGFQINRSENACAYTATYSVSGDEGIITMHKLGKVIPANTAVIIVGEDSEISMTASTADAENTVSNNLRGLDEAKATATVKTDLGADALLMLSNKNSHFGFHDYAGSTVPAGKAFLALNGSEAKVRTFAMVFEGETSGIAEAEANSSLFTLHSSLSEWYTLDGRRLGSKPTAKGVYVRGGVKVVVK